MDALTALIDQERAKLRILEAEVQARKQRIQTLEGMRSGGDLDALLAKLAPAPQPQPQVAPAPQVAQPANQQASILPIQESEGTRRKRGEVKRTLLSMLRPDKDRKVSELLAELREQHYPDFEAKRLRGELWNFKNEGLVKSTLDAWYRLTDKGVAFLEGQEGERPGGAGRSVATGSVKDLL